MRLFVTLGCGALLVACAAPGHDTAAPCTPCAPPAPVVSLSAPRRSPELDQLGQRRVDLARKRIELLRLMYERGGLSLGDLTSAYHDVAFAARDSGLRGDALRKPLEDYRDAMRNLAELTDARFKQGAVNQADVASVQSHVAEAEFWLAEAVAAARGATGSFPP
jgi:hypothetical protein